MSPPPASIYTQMECRGSSPTAAGLSLSARPLLANEEPRGQGGTQLRGRAHDQEGGGGGCNQEGST